jgi:hypothetical protein
MPHPGAPDGEHRIPAQPGTRNDRIRVPVGRYGRRANQGPLRGRAGRISPATCRCPASAAGQPWHRCFVRYAEQEPVTLTTPQGHMFAGWIMFSAERDGAATIIRAHVLMRAGDPLYGIAMNIRRSRQGRPVSVADPDRAGHPPRRAGAPGRHPQHRCGQPPAMAARQAGGSARLTDAMAGAVAAAGGQVETGRWVRSLAELPPTRVTLRQVGGAAGGALEPVPDPAAGRLPVLGGDPARPGRARPLRRTGRADRAPGRVRRPGPAGPGRAGTPPGHRDPPPR